MTSWAQPSPEAFVYRPLDTSKQEIRLLRLVINHRGKVEALIEHVHIETAPPYRALSYTWGSEDVTNVICLNGCTFEIRQNLFEFFDVYMCRYAQKAEEIDRETHWLWVDQICVDQATTLERNHQVQLMAQVYNSANEVITWLHKETPDVEHESFSCDAQCYEEGHALDSIGRPCDYIAAFALHTYWQRVWIAQEVLLAKRWTIWYGTDVISQQDFQDLQLWEYPWLADQHAAMESFEFLRRHRRFDSYQTKPFDEVLGTVPRMCVDPRDQVYGVQALVREQDRIDVDYSRSKTEVFADAVCVLIHEYLLEFDCAAIDGLARRMGVDAWIESSLKIKQCTHWFWGEWRGNEWKRGNRSELHNMILFIAEGDLATYRELLLERYPSLRQPGGHSAENPVYPWDLDMTASEWKGIQNLLRYLDNT